MSASGSVYDLAQESEVRARMTAHVRFTILTLAVLGLGFSTFIWQLWPVTEVFPWMPSAVLLLSIIAGSLAQGRYARGGISFRIGVPLLSAALLVGSLWLDGGQGGASLVERWNAREAAWLFAGGMICFAVLNLLLSRYLIRGSAGPAADSQPWKLAPWLLGAALAASLAGLGWALAMGVAPTLLDKIAPWPWVDALGLRHAAAWLGKKESTLAWFSWVSVLPIVGFTLTLALIYLRCTPQVAARRALGVLCVLSLLAFAGTFWGASVHWAGEYIALLGMHAILSYIGLSAALPPLAALLRAVAGLGGAGALVTAWLFPERIPAWADAKALLIFLSALAAGLLALYVVNRIARPAGNGVPAPPLPATAEEPIFEEEAVPLPRRRVAYVVVHGMAQQQRHETLDAFVSGFQNMGGQGQPEWRVRLRTLVERHGNDYRDDATGYRVPLSNRRVIDAYEIYWAPLAQGAQTWRAVLSWMGIVLSGALGGIIRFGSENRDERTHRDVMRKQWAMGSYLAAAAGAVAAGVWVMWDWFLRMPPVVRKLLAQVLSWESLSWQKVTGLDRDVWFALILLGFVAWAVLNVLNYGLQAVATIGQLWATHRQNVRDPVLTPPGRQSRAAEQLVLLLGTAIIWAVWETAAFHVLREFAKHGKFSINGTPLDGPELVNLAVWLGTALFVVMRVKEFMADTFGDVPTYVTYNEFTPQSKARRAIRDKAFNILTIALEEYEQVILVGHSLGSVVTRDLVRDLWLNRPDLFLRLKALVTIGSPLRKIHAVVERQEVRPYGQSPLDASYAEQIYRSPPGWQRDQTADPETKSVSEKVPPIPWYNFWILTDLFADPLRDQFPVTYEEQVPWELRGMHWSHSDYWKVRMFYEALEGMLAPAADQPGKQAI